ncbi:MAG: protein kinase [Pseudomonadota bacterium]|nr:protein kinase [Pseudomonadota bacterium]
MPPPPEDPKPAERVGPWRLDRLLGQGGMARVYRAVGEDGAAVALKWLYRATPGIVARFEDEVRFLQRLDHSGVVRYRGNGVERGLPWVAMEYVEGQDLRVYTEKLRLRPPSERQVRAREIATALCRALAYVHAQGLVHRDVKPSNVLLEAKGRVLLTDFGVACAIDEPPAGAGGTLVGTAAYAAPEQIAGGRVDARADQYGLGCTLYYLLTGRRPFEDVDTAALLHAHLERPPRPPSERDPTVAPELEAFVLRLLAKDPAARFADMAEAEAAISSAAPVGLPLAGRQATIDAVAAALDRVAGGDGVVVRLVGQRGSGRTWIQALAREAADRRGLPCVATDDAIALDAAVRHVASGEALLVVTTLASPGATELLLAPLTLADLRRSVYAFAPATPDLARVSERLHRETGGNASLALELFERHVDKGRIVLPDGPLTVDARRFVEGLDLDEEAVAGALAVLAEPAPVSLLEAVAQVPPETALVGLEDRGVALRAGDRWMLAAEALRGPLRARMPDPEHVEARAAALVDRPAVAVVDPLLGEVEVLRAAGRTAEAEAKLVAALAGPESGDVRGARLVVLGRLLWDAGEATGARAIFEEALATLVDPAARRRATVDLGVAALQTGDLDTALDRFTEAATDADLAGDAHTASLASMHLAEARALAGALADALRAARRALALAEGLRDRALECAAIRHLGQVLLDAGLASEAGRHLADASALARAADLAEERVAAQVLRARATLEERPNNRTAAASALDRLLPQLRAPASDPEGFHLLARCVWANAAGVLGDVRMYRRALAEADPAAARGRLTLRLRADVLLARAALAAGDLPEVTVRARRVCVEATARGFGLLAWEADRLLARAANTPLPPPGELARGLEAEAVLGLERR